MKQFLYDTLLGPENICNLDSEIGLIKSAVAKKKKLVIYGPRNYGKTSVIQNVIIPHFQKQHSKSFVLFCDLMEVKNLDNISQRMKKAFESGFAQSFKTKSKVNQILELLSRLRPSLTTDPLTGQMVLSVSLGEKGDTETFQQIFRTVMSFSEEVPSLIVLDEFQDVANIDQAQGLFRQVFQEISDVPLILMGSKQHLLAEIFSVPKAPLAGFGEDLEFGSIPFEKYHEYIEERFEQRGLKIDFHEAKGLQLLLNRNPESVNIVCSFLVDQYQNCQVDIEKMRTAIDSAVKNRKSRFEQILGTLNGNEEVLLTTICNHQPVKYVTSRDFLSKVGLSSRGASLSVKSLYDRSLLSKNEKGYFVADALLAHFLRRYR